MTEKKSAVLLLNLGSPNSTSTKDVRSYLKEFLSDERVIDINPIAKWFVLNCLILPFRPKKSAAAYKRVWQKEGSPLIITSKAQQELLQERLNIPVALAMRYGPMSVEKAVKDLIKQGVNDLFIIPLYPHYAMSSYETAVVEAETYLKDQAPHISSRVLQPFYKDPGYIKSLLTISEPYLQADYDHLLFSFHGIPERHLKQTDPSKGHCMARANCCSTPNPCQATCYRHQCFEMVKAFVAAANIPEGKYSVAFQSRLGREPWLKPHTDEVLEELPSQGVKKVMVMSPSFTTDCLETLEELAMEGAEEFIKAGGKSFELIPCPNTDTSFIDWLSDKVESWQPSAVKQAELAYS